MSLLARLFGKTATSTEILCPHCERSMDAGHDVEACARRRMSRRYFFGLLGGAAAVAAMPPSALSLDAFTERYIDPAARALADSIDRNSILSPQMISREFLVSVAGRLGGPWRVQREYNRLFTQITEVSDLRPEYRAFIIS